MRTMLAMAMIVLAAATSYGQALAPPPPMPWMGPAGAGDATAEMMKVGEAKQWSDCYRDWSKIARENAIVSRTACITAGKSPAAGDVPLANGDSAAATAFGQRDTGDTLLADAVTAFGNGNYLNCIFKARHSAWCYTYSCWLFSKAQGLYFTAKSAYEMP